MTHQFSVNLSSCSALIRQKQLELTTGMEQNESQTKLIAFMFIICLFAMKLGKVTLTKFIMCLHVLLLVVFPTYII